MKKMKKFLFIINPQKAFTIPEILIAMGLFLVVITTSSSIFLLALRTQKQLITFLNLAENLSYALEVMARDIRMGNNFSIDSQSQILTFLNYKNQLVTYRLNNKILERAIEGANFEPLTSPSLKISYLKFLISGEQIYDERQTRITITLEGETTIRKTPIKFNLQTTLSPRALNI